MLATIPSNQCTWGNVQKLAWTFIHISSPWGNKLFSMVIPIFCSTFLSNFRNLNKQLKQKPYPMPNINGMLLKLEGFQYDMSLDLNMGYYHIRLSKNSSNLCTIIIPWVKYRYKRLPMGVANFPDIFQQKMNDLFHVFYSIRV